MCFSTVGIVNPQSIFRNMLYHCSPFALWMIQGFSMVKDCIDEFEDRLQWWRLYWWIWGEVAMMKIVLMDLDGFDAINNAMFLYYCCKMGFYAYYAFDEFLYITSMVWIAYVWFFNTVGHLSGLWNIDTINRRKQNWGDLQQCEQYNVSRT